MRGQLGKFQEWVSTVGISLDSIGVSGRALARQDAMKALDLAREEGVLILGGDVYFRLADKIIPAYANWHVDRWKDESDEGRILRSIEESKAYIEALKEPQGKDMLIALVSL